MSWWVTDDGTVIDEDDDGMTWNDGIDEAEEDIGDKHTAPQGRT